MVIKINDRIRVRTIQFFNNFKINLKYDALASSFAFNFYFDPKNREHIDMACMGHYHFCTIEHNNEVLLTGQILSETFNSSATRQLVSLAGYSLPGILEDCEIMDAPELPPPTRLSEQWEADATVADNPATQLQIDGLNLRQIAEKLIKPFGLSMVIDSIVADRMEEVFDESEARMSQNIKSYLSQLAGQKNITLSHNNKGQLVFTQAPPFQQSICHFDGSLPVTSMSLAFDGQGMHSHIKAVTQADVDDVNSTDNMVRNPYVINTVFRPKVIIQNSKSVVTDNALAAKNVRAQELKGLNLTVKTDRWIINNKIIRPGKLISVTNPEIYLFKKSNWLIEEVELEGDEKKQTAVLKCVLPEVYNGQDPQYIFKGINLH